MLLFLIPVLGMIFALREARAQSVTQPDGPVSVSEGASLELRCNYSYGATPNLFWYAQYPSQGLQLLLKYISGNPLVKGIKGFEAEFRKSESSFNLRKHSAHWDDSAEYFCVVSDTVLWTAGGAEHKPPETVGRICSKKELLLVPEIYCIRKILDSDMVVIVVFVSCRDLLSYYGTDKH